MKISANNEKSKVNYGREMIEIMVIALVLSVGLFGIAIWKGVLYSTSGILSHLWIMILCIFLSLAGIAFFIAGTWSSRVGKFRMRDKIFENLEMNGNEEVLDVGCGRGLLLIAAAKRLTTGMATGTDHWKGTVEYRNTSEMTWENARIEGVADKIKITDGDVTSLSFSDNQFDIVTTSLMMHHVKNTDLALKEMVRVLKSNGTLVIADIAARRFRSSMQHLGLTIVQTRFATRLFFMPVRILIGKKVK
jgi:cyclopropane fatty-acyl-phospholipid synthase-like methyltransferase